MISPFLLLFSFSDPSDCDNRRTDDCGYDNFGHKHVPSFAYPLIHSGNGLSFGFVTFTMTGSFPFGHPRGQRQFFVGPFAHSQDRSRQIAFIADHLAYPRRNDKTVLLLGWNIRLSADHTQNNNTNHTRETVSKIPCLYGVLVSTFPAQPAEQQLLRLFLTLQSRPG